MTLDAFLLADFTRMKIPRWPAALPRGATRITRMSMTPDKFDVTGDMLGSQSSNYGDRFIIIALLLISALIY